MIDIRQDFYDEIALCLNPEFSPNTFNGSNADDFHTHRRMDLQEHFKDVSNTQTMNAIAKMQEKINELTSDEDDIKEKISDLQKTKSSLISEYNKREYEQKINNRYN